MCFFDKFDSLCRAHGKSANGVAKELGLSSGVVTTWKQNKTTPRHTTIKKIADYFHMSVDDLMRGVGDGLSEPSTAGERIPTDEDIQAAFWGGYKDLTQDEISAMWDEVRAYAQFKAEEARRKKKK